jgi:hypothetical protein
LCAQYPSWKHCGCPLKAGGYALKDIKYNLPDLGVLGAVMAVSTNKLLRYLQILKEATNINNFKAKTKRCLSIKFYKMTIFFYRAITRARLCSMASPTPTTFLAVSTWPSPLLLASDTMNSKLDSKSEFNLTKLLLYTLRNNINNSL